MSEDLESIYLKDKYPRKPDENFARLNLPASEFKKFVTLLKKEDQPKEKENFEEFLRSGQEQKESLPPQNVEQNIETMKLISDIDLLSDDKKNVFPLTSINCEQKNDDDHFLGSQPEDKKIENIYDELKAKNIKIDEKNEKLNFNIVNMKYDSPLKQLKNKLIFLKVLIVVCGVILVTYFNFFLINSLILVIINEEGISLELFLNANFEHLLFTNFYLSIVVFFWGICIIIIAIYFHFRSLNANTEPIFIFLNKIRMVLIAFNAVLIIGTLHQLIYLLVKDFNENEFEGNYGNSLRVSSIILIFFAQIFKILISSALVILLRNLEKLKCNLRKMVDETKKNLF